MNRALSMAFLVLIVGCGEIKTTEEIRVDQKLDEAPVTDEEMNALKSGK